MIRALRDNDVPGVIALLRAVEPTWVVSDAAFRHHLANASRQQRMDWVTEVGGEIVGWARAGRHVTSERDDVARVQVLVLPERRGRGFGSALYDHAGAHVRALAARRVTTSGPDDGPSRRFAEQRGFRHTHTSTSSRLELTADHLRQLQRLLAAKAEEGFGLARYADFADRPELVHAVDAEAARDEPGDEPQVNMPLETWLTQTWGDPGVSREASAVVMHEEKPVAIAELIVDLDGMRARNGFTGTLRSYRGRRLARLAKLASISWAYEHGIRSLVTSNDETNAPMLALNRSLGYRPFASTLSYVRDES